MPPKSSELQPCKKINDILQSMKYYGAECDRKVVRKHLSGLLVDKVCLLCFKEEGDPGKYGCFIHHTNSGIWVHYFCLLLASGLEQRCKGSECDIMETPQGIYGFLIKDIFEEFQRGLKLRCTYCNKRGATIGCCTPKCKSRFHFCCGLERQALSQYFGSFQSFCRKHKPVQLRTQCEVHSNDCRICFEEIEQYEDRLFPPCCRNAWFHRDCIQKQALSSGLYFFRCPICSDKDKYTEEMLRMGVYIPSRDASWETADAFTDLLEPRIYCDAADCKCLKGRKHERTRSIWEIVICKVCGLSGSHIACALLKSITSPFVCDICTTVLGYTSVRKTLTKMGFNSNDLIPFNHDAPDTTLKDAKTHKTRTKHKKRKRDVEGITPNEHSNRKKKVK